MWAWIVDETSTLVRGNQSNESLTSQPGPTAVLIFGCLCCFREVRRVCTAACKGNSFLFAHSWFSPSLSFSGPISSSLKALSLANVHLLFSQLRGLVIRRAVGRKVRADICIAALIAAKIACLGDQFHRVFFFPPSPPHACFNCTILRPYGSNITQWVTLGDISEIAQGENNSGSVYPEPQKLRADAGIHYGP